METAAKQQTFRGVNVVDHPLVAARLGVLRDHETATVDFRRSLQELSIMLLVEAARSWATSPVAIETPLSASAGAVLSKHVALIPVLRAGVGMLDGMLRLLPDARVGHLGLYRDELTLRPVTYYQRLPASIATAQVLLLDPMLATGFSACEAVSILKANGARDIQFICVVACPQGIEQLQTQHADVPIFTAAIDPELNQFGYIVPGLGDAGDRYFGTL
ncbi:MAG: uracil phosphoribosyltransferase [Chthoniobacterales bacterium]